jgi:hypothetical protein
VRYVYARAGLGLAQQDADIAGLNSAYDLRHRPKHIPVALPAPPDFEQTLARYQEAVSEAKRSQPEARPRG